MDSAILEAVRHCLAMGLGTSADVSSLNLDSPLLGHVEQLDSLGVVNVLLSMEEQFSFNVEDDEIDASVFETVGTLCDFVVSKTAGL